MPKSGLAWGGRRQRREIRDRWLAGRMNPFVLARETSRISPPPPRRDRCFSSTSCFAGFDRQHLLILSAAVARAAPLIVSLTDAEPTDSIHPDRDLQDLCRFTDRADAVDLDDRCWEGVVAPRSWAGRGDPIAAVRLADLVAVRVSRHRVVFGLLCLRTDGC